eukprot:471964-Rhodomonas_salina.1
MKSTEGERKRERERKKGRGVGDKRGRRAETFRTSYSSSRPIFPKVFQAGTGIADLLSVNSRIVLHANQLAVSGGTTAARCQRASPSRPAVLLFQRIEGE